MKEKNSSILCATPRSPLFTLCLKPAVSHYPASLATLRSSFCNSAHLPYLASLSRYYSYINTAKEILSGYRGQEPFAIHLKKYFAANKKSGSRDRKQISQLCYAYFRCGHALDSFDREQRIIAALFLTSTASNEMLQTLQPDWNTKAHLSVTEKLTLLGATPDALFPFASTLSAGIDNEVFALSHIIQPDLFIRLRPGQEETVKTKLNAAGILFEEKEKSCLALTNATKLEEVIAINKEAVIQDYSSQQIKRFFQVIKAQSINNKISVWDCCAASGGKSILAKDILGNISLTVSDVRESILFNLKKRFAEAGITNYKSFSTDLSLPDYRLLTTDSGLVICDVPCTGSGTWGRTPEQLLFFEETKINNYVHLQRKIISNVIPALAADGYFLYITCSAFQKENEDNVTFIKENFHLQLLQMEVIKGYEQKADTMFAALFRK